MALWNVAWKTPTSTKGREIARILAHRDADVICLTEGYAGLLPEFGHQILSDSDHGYRTSDGRRKVLLWSRWPWQDVDIVGSSDLPSGRFVRGRLETPSGSATVIGVCIPWAHAHVSTGRRDRRPWQDHEAYIDGLERILGAEDAGTNLIVVVDFNQKLPVGRGPNRVRERLLRALGNLRICTTGAISGVDELSIDHVAHSAGLVATAVSGWEPVGGGGDILSDHFGLCIDLQDLEVPTITTAAG